MKWYGDPLYRGYSHKKHYSLSYTWLDEIPCGWRKAFGKELCKEIKEAGKSYIKQDEKWSDILFFEQIKEKWGELCLYASAKPEIMHVLEKYELISTFYCINCGKKAHYRTSGWIEYYCKDCFLEDLHRADNYRSTSLTKEDEERALKDCRVSVDDVPEIHRYNDEEILTEKFNTEEECRNRQKEMHDKSIDNMFYKVRENDDGTWSLIHTRSIKYKVDLEKEYNISFKELQSDEED